MFVFKSLLIMLSNVLPLHLKQTFRPIIWTFSECEGDQIESRLPFKIFSTLHSMTWEVMFSKRHFRKFEKSWLLMHLILKRTWKVGLLFQHNNKSKILPQILELWKMYQKTVRKRLVFFVLQSWGWKVAIRYTIRIYFNFVLCMIGKDQWHSPNGHGSR